MAAAARCRKMEIVLHIKETVFIYKVMGTELTVNLQLLEQVVKADHMLGIARKTVGNKTEHYYCIM